MNAKLLSHGRKLWDVPYVPKQTRRHNLLAWARSVHQLGDRWLLAKKVPRKTTPDQ